MKQPDYGESRSKDGVASVQIRATARRECESEFRALGHAEHNERWPTKFNLKIRTSKGLLLQFSRFCMSQDLSARTVLKPFAS